MNIEVYEINFSLDQPGYSAQRILEKLQQRLTQARTHTGGQLFQIPHHVLLVDNHKQRVGYFGSLLSGAGYQYMVTATTVEAFTLILQGNCMPFALIIGQEDAKQRFFLNRLFQRMEQQYDWDLLLIRLQTQPIRNALPKSHTLLPLDENATPPALPSVTPPPMTSMSGLPQFPPSFPQPNPQLLDGGSFSGITYLPPSTPMSTPMTPLPPVAQSTGPIPAEQLSFAQSSPVLPIPEEPPRPVEQTAPSIPLEGQDIGRYRVVARIGMPQQAGNTYRAYDRLREKEVALKALHADTIPYHMLEGTTAEVNLFQQEARLTEDLDHPHILRVLNTGRSYISGASFIYKTMLLCSGGSLAQWLREHGARSVFSPQEVLPLIWQLADALQYLHDHGLVYQNFKFSNILIKSEVDDLRDLQIVLSDIPVVQNRAYIPKSSDTYAYVAPERWAGTVLPASDQYALAAITYELLVGRPPFQGSSEHTMRLLHTTMQAQPPRMHNPALLPVANDILLHALEKKPENRFASVAAFAQIFRSYFGQ
jgi:hypothetical protein